MKNGRLCIWLYWKIFVYRTINIVNCHSKKSIRVRHFFFFGQSWLHTNDLRFHRILSEHTKFEEFQCEVKFLHHFAKSFFFSFFIFSLLSIRNDVVSSNHLNVIDIYIFRKYWFDWCHQSFILFRRRKRGFFNGWIRAGGEKKKKCFPPAVWVVMRNS